MRILLASFTLIVLSQFALANTASVLSCVSQKYAAMTDRHGIAIAVVDANESQYVFFGAAKKNQIFEIGSLTKTFTATLLAQEVLAGKLKISDPIPNEYQKTGSVISYQHLTTHTSGIIGGNFPGYASPNPESPYEGLTIPLFKELYAKTPLVAPAGQKWIYSNIGESLLGLIMSEKNGRPYNDLVAERILKPLEMSDTYFEVPESERTRFPHGSLNDKTWSYWDLYKTAISPAGSIRSTITDMAKYAKAQLTPAGSSLGPAIELSHQPLFQISPALSIGMNWILETDKYLIWHDGSTLGFNSILAVSKKQNVAIVALTDSAVLKPDSKGKMVLDTSFEDVAKSCLE